MAAAVAVRDDGDGGDATRFVGAIADTSLAQMKDIIRELFESEISWLKTVLTNEQKIKLIPQWNASMGFEAPINHICVTGEIALVLAGLGPCCVVSNDNYPEFGQLFYQQVLKPWYDNDKYFLKGSDFVCETAAPDVAYANPTGRLALPRDVRTRTEFGNGVVFRNSAHRDSAYAQQVFSRRDNIITEEVLQVCFGYPFALQGRNLSTIMYQFLNPESVFNIDQCCCSPCLQYNARAEDAQQVERHFRRCMEAMEVLGYSIALDIENQELEFDAHVWNATAIGKAYYEAAGGSFEEFERMMKADADDVLLGSAPQDKLWMRCGQEKRDQIIMTVLACCRLRGEH